MIQFLSEVLNAYAYNGDYKETDNAENFLIHWIILIGVYKSKTGNTLQLGSKDGHLPFSKILNHTSFQKILEVLHSRMHTAKRRPRRNNKNKATREVFEISNHYAPDSCMTVEELVICRQCCLF